MRTLIISFSILTIFLAAGCRPEAPGEGSAHAEGSKVSQTVVAALEKFKKENGKYPAHLDELVPKYIPANPQRAKNGDTNANVNGSPKSEIYYDYFLYDNGRHFSLGYSYWNFFWKDECIYNSERKFGVCGSQPPGGAVPAENSNKEKTR